MPTPVTIIIANHNYGRFLEEAVRSVLSQDHPSVELIVVDDGSTDGSRTLIDGLVKETGGLVRAIYQERRGVAAARNVGIRAANGSYIGFLDADDILHTNSVSTLARYLDTHEHISIVYANAELFASADGRSLGRWFSRETGRTPCWGRFTAELLFSGNFIPIQTALLRRMVFEEAGSFDEHYRVGEDWELWLRLSARYDMRYLDVTLSKIRRHAANLSFIPLNALMQLRILRQMEREQPAAVMRIGEERMLVKRFEANYEIGRQMYLAGRRRRARLFLMRARRIEKNRSFIKMTGYFILTFFPWPGLVRRLRSAWRNVFPSRQEPRLASRGWI